MSTVPSWIHYEPFNQFYWQGAGVLSIKSFSGGQALYEVGRGAFLVDDQCYLVLNHGEEYAITIESEKPVMAFCIFFAPDLARDVKRSHLSRAETLLDDPSPTSASPPSFFERTYPHDDLLSPMLERIRQEYPLRHYESSWLTEQYHSLVGRLLLVHQQASREVADLPALRPGTRQELYRRLHRARDYIKAYYPRQITLQDIAEVASLSPNHLLRTFKQLFKQSPHQYLVNERLHRTRQLLLTTDQPITDICVSVGFTSLGSFSWLFRRRFGLPPQRFRALNKKG